VLVEGESADSCDEKIITTSPQFVMRSWTKTHTLCHRDSNGDAIPRLCIKQILVRVTSLETSFSVITCFRIESRPGQKVLALKGPDQIVTSEHRREVILLRTRFALTGKGGKERGRDFGRAISEIAIRKSRRLHSHQFVLPRIANEGGQA